MKRMLIVILLALFLPCLAQATDNLDYFLGTLDSEKSPLKKVYSLDLCDNLEGVASREKKSPEKKRYLVLCKNVKKKFAVMFLLNKNAVVGSISFVDSYSSNELCLEKKLKEKKKVQDFFGESVIVGAECKKSIALVRAGLPPSFFLYLDIVPAKVFERAAKDIVDKMINRLRRKKYDERFLQDRCVRLTKKPPEGQKSGLFFKNKEIGSEYLVIRVDRTNFDNEGNNIYSYTLNAFPLEKKEAFYRSVKRKKQMVRVKNTADIQHLILDYFEEIPCPEKVGAMLRVMLIQISALESELS